MLRAVFRAWDSGVVLHSNLAHINIHFFSEGLPVAFIGRLIFSHALRVVYSSTL